MAASNLGTPALTTDLTRKLRLMDNLQWHPICADFELRAVECYESYGYGSPNCKDYMDDLRECLYGLKKELRVHVMMKERLTQYREGSREQLYAPPPPGDAH